MGSQKMGNAGAVVVAMCLFSVVAELSFTDTPRAQMSHVYGARRAVATGLGAQKLDNSDMFDSMWDEEEEEEEAAAVQQNEQESVAEATLAPGQIRTPAPYEPTASELRAARRLHGDRMSEAQLIAYLRRKHDAAAPLRPEPTADSARGFDAAPKITHLSSAQFELPRANPHWNQSAFRGDTAISSEDVFPEQRRVGFRQTLFNTFERAVGDLDRAIEKIT